MPHADASNFDGALSRAEGYESILSSLSALITETPPNRNWISATANCSSLLWHMFHALSPSDPASAVNWVGFYVLDPKVEKQIILGPFHGKVACQTIRFGQGVCGAVASSGTTEIVPDVEKRPGHVFCDGDSKSEIVVPVIARGKTVGVLDIDCAELDGFGQDDRQELEKIAKLLGDECEW